MSISICLSDVFSSLKILIQNFPLDSIDTPLNEDAKKKLNQGLKDFTYNIYQILNNSIFNGDYVNTKNFIVLLENINFEEFENELTNDDLNIHIQDFIEKEIKSKALKEIRTSIIAYRRFVSSLDNRLSFSGTKYYINTLVKTRYDFVNLKSNSISDDCKIFDSNLFIAYCDHFVSSIDKDVLLNLEDVLDFLKEKDTISQYRHVDILYKKALFIRYKFIFREVEEKKQNNISATIYVAKKEKSVVFNPDSFINEFEDLKLFKNWNEYLLNHYQINNEWRQNILHSVKSSFDLNTLKISELHQVVKFAKDIEKDPRIIVRVRKVLLKKLIETTDQFDQYCLKICVLYAFNNEISFIADNPSTSELEIENLYNEIEEFISEYRVKNYFSTAKYLRYITAKLELMISEKVVFDKYDECQKLLSKANELIFKYRDNIDWVKNNYNYTFQLPKSECQIKYDDQLDIFVASTFMLPISRISLDINFKNDLESINVFKIIIDSLAFTKDSKDKIIELTEKNENLSSEIRENEKSKLETVAVVTAIMTFVAGSIPGFKFINTGIEAISFTLSLGLSLSLFVLLFFGMSRGFNTIKKYLYILIPVILGCCALLYYVSNLNLDFKEEEPNKINIENSFDFKHQNNNIKIDSLKSKN